MASIPLNGHNLDTSKAVSSYETEIQSAEAALQTYNTLYGGNASMSIGQFQHLVYSVINASMNHVKTATEILKEKVKEYDPRKDSDAEDGTGKGAMDLRTEHLRLIKTTAESLNVVSENVMIVSRSYAETMQRVAGR